MGNVGDTFGKAPTVKHPLQIKFLDISVFAYHRMYVMLISVRVFAQYLYFYVCVFYYVFDHEHICLLNLSCFLLS